MILSVHERLVLLSVLPQEGSFATLKIVRTLRESLSFDEAETKRYGLKETTIGERTQYHWDTTVDQGNEIPIGEKATEIVREALKKLDAGGKLTDREYTLYEKFVEE